MIRAASSQTSSAFGHSSQPFIIRFLAACTFPLPPPDAQKRSMLEGVSDWSLSQISATVWLSLRRLRKKQKHLTVKICSSIERTDVEMLNYSV